MQATRAALQRIRDQRFDVAFYTPWISDLLVPGTGPPAGGAETQTLMLARALARSGRRVCVIAYGSRDSLPRSVDGITVLTQRRPGPRAKPIRIPLWALFAIRTLGPLRARVFVQRAAGATTGVVALFARTKRSRFVYSSAGVIDFEFERLERRRYWVWLFHLGVRLASTIVVQTNEQVRMCRTRFQREPVLIKSIAEHATPARTEMGADCASEPVAFLWVGRAAPYKHPEACVELAASLPEARFQMVLVAENPGNELAREIQKRSGQVPNLELLEPLPRAELMRLVDSAVAMVNTADYEGMPNIFLESWARGVPALCLSHDPDGVIERDQIGLFAAGSPNRLVEAARTLWRSRGDRAELAARCRAYVEREHSPEVITERWIQALRLSNSGAEDEVSA
jgi:glycosyltransferase involved in cell wall biosynthesis